MEPDSSEISFSPIDFKDFLPVPRITKTIAKACFPSMCVNICPKNIT